MKKEMKNLTEYKTPKCRIVTVQAQNLVCTSPYGVDGAAGPDVTVENDDYDY